jgi:hypothetical protein
MLMVKGPNNFLVFMPRLWEVNGSNLDPKISRSSVSYRLFLNHSSKLCDSFPKLCQCSYSIHSYDLFYSFFTHFIPKDEKSLILFNEHMNLEVYV